MSQLHMGQFTKDTHQIPKLTFGGQITFTYVYGSIYLHVLTY